MIGDGVRPKSDRSAVRQKRNRSGARAETVAAIYLMLRGHRILARRFKTPLGEIDLVACKGRRIAFVEVKRRETIADCEAALTPKLSLRMRRAADLWRSRQPKFVEHDIGFDAIFVLPWRLPIYRENSL